MTMLAQYQDAYRNAEENIAQFSCKTILLKEHVSYKITLFQFLT